MAGGNQIEGDEAAGSVGAIGSLMEVDMWTLDKVAAGDMPVVNRSSAVGRTEALGILGLDMREAPEDPEDSAAAAVDTDLDTGSSRMAPEAAPARGSLAVGHIA